jgi:hypothetical protein
VVQEASVRKIAGIVCVVAALMVAAFAASPKGKPASQDNANSIVIVFKDGHQQTFPMGDVARIEFTAPPTTASGSWPAHFVGKWKVGVGDGMGGTFLITLQRNGEAKKDYGAAHGTWTVVDGEARITWDDGWHDAIRKTSAGYEKAAFGPGKSFSDTPSNVAEAKSTEPI